MPEKDTDTTTIDRHSTLFSQAVFKQDFCIKPCGIQFSVGSIQKNAVSILKTVI